MESALHKKVIRIFLQLNLIICLVILWVTYFSKNPHERFWKFWTHQHRLILPEYLQKENYVYSDIKASFNNANNLFTSFSSDLTLQCASELWNLYRDPLTADPWQNGRVNSSDGKADIFSVSKRPFVHMFFIGDSHIRYIFDVFVKRIASPRVKYRIASVPEKWEDVFVMTENRLHNLHEAYHDVIHLDYPLKLTFIWNPYCDRLPELLKKWLAGNETRPNVLFVGIAYHFMLDSRDIYQKTGEENASINFRHHMKVLAPLLDEFGKTTPTIFKLADHVQRKDFKVFGNSNVDYYNNISRSVLSGTHVTLMDSTHPLVDLYIEECRARFKNTHKSGVWQCSDTMHFGYIIVDQFIDMLLNALCNGVIY